MAISTFSPEENPSRANFNRRITQANSDIAAKQDRLSGTAGQVVGFDANGRAVAQAAPDTAVDSITIREIDEIMAVQPEFSCVMTVSGSGRNGQAWSASCTLGFWSRAGRYTADGTIAVDTQGGIISKCAVTGVPVVKVTQNCLSLSDAMFLYRDASGEYSSDDTAGLAGFFGTSGSATEFTAAFVERDNQPSGPFLVQGV